MHLLFVYNATSNKLSKAMDFAHKIISPSTYACDLCALTHGAFKEKQEWRTFLDNTSHTFEFVYKDVFEKEGNEKQAYPVILRKENTQKHVVCKAEDLAKLSSINDLISVLKALE